MITIIDLKLGNIGSVSHAFTYLGHTVQHATSPEAIEQASILVLPGVGTFGEGMASLNRHNLAEPLRRAIRDRSVPCLGICLGMQLLATTSREYGERGGLNLLPGHVVPLSPKHGIVPHMGWCAVQTTTANDATFAPDRENIFYFAHSFHFICTDPEYVCATFSWGTEQLVAAVRHKALWGVQFHPEKSQHCGLDYLDSFCKHYC